MARADFTLELMKIEAKIKDVEALYLAEKEMELRTNKKNILISRVYAARLEALGKKRAAIAKHVHHVNNAWIAWRTEVGIKEAVIAKDEQTLRDLRVQYANAIVQKSVSKSQSLYREISRLAKDIASTELAIRNRRRGLSSFRLKEPPRDRKSVV